jgi:hypothetical protein
LHIPTNKSHSIGHDEVTVSHAVAPPMRSLLSVVSK